MCIRDSTRTGQINYKPSFYYIAHFSRHIKEHARRIATTCYSEQMEVTAFENQMCIRDRFKDDALTAYPELTVE